MGNVKLDSSFYHGFDTFVSLNGVYFFLSFMSGILEGVFMYSKFESRKGMDVWKF